MIKRPFWRKQNESGFRGTRPLSTPIPPPPTDTRAEAVLVPQIWRVQVGDVETFHLHKEVLSPSPNLHSATASKSPKQRARNEMQFETLFVQ